ncbi:MAG: hypothetical protein RL759_917 [Verrucomicrobiota bacterium]
MVLSLPSMHLPKRFHLKQAQKSRTVVRLEFKAPTEITVYGTEISSPVTDQMVARTSQREKRAAHRKGAKKEKRNSR